MMPSEDGTCITCGDVAEEVRVIRVDGATALAVCRTDGGCEITADVGLVSAPAAGDRLLVHAGAAIARLDPGGGRV